MNAVYCRISSDDGSGRSVSIQRQRDECLTAAANLGFTIAPDFVFVDEGKTGRNLKRPAIQKLIALIKQNAIRRLFVYELSRLSRDVIDSQSFRQLCKTHNCELIALYGVVDDSTPEGEFALGIGDQLNQYWSRKTSYSLKRYRKHARASGIYAPHKSPIGLLRSGKFPNIVWEQTADFSIVLEVLDLYVGGMGCNSIARELIQRGRTWKSGKTDRKPPNPDSVLNLINGIERYEQFLPPALYALVLNIRAERKAHQGNHHPLKHPPLLCRGLIRCAVCGASYYTHHSPKDVLYEWSYYHASYLTCANPFKTIARDAADKQAWYWFDKVLPQIFDPSASAMLPLPPARDLQKERDALNSQLKKLAVMLAAERITEPEYDALRRDALAALKSLDAEAVAAAKPKLNAGLLKELVHEPGYASFAYAAGALDPHRANQMLKLVFEAFPILGREFQTPVLKEAWEFVTV